MYRGISKDFSETVGGVTKSYGWLVTYGFDLRDGLFKLAIFYILF